MKKFILKAFIFLILVISVLSFILVKYGGYVDYFYNKFTSPAATSLILGDSRSLQGIQPKIINDYFKNAKLDTPILNYSFTLKQISYGKPYLESIKLKLDKTTKNGLFIISVHPFVLSDRSENNEEQNGIFFEEDMPPHNMKNVNSNPNYEYLYKNFDYFHFRGIIRKSSKTHKDGWLEETNLPNDTILLNTWKKNQIKLYSGFASAWKKSNLRLKSLEELCEYLEQYGQVKLVRLPIDKELLDIENKYWGNFNQDMSKISEKTNANFINFSLPSPKDKFSTYDGIHIDKFAGVYFTKALCDSISKSLDLKSKHK
ncbi:hypothetical protein Q4599_06885 [Cellulophaga lytica]|uniref:hypothetical protein n=1 Tax=Cellulophaga lytica TaxID=979 RepID=UPI0026E381C6|nr:hypothetical protein [Cellulophaga lytica]MDO6853299.1 hypothetical protein [Cellulophaga lytica]